MAKHNNHHKSNSQKSKNTLLAISLIVMETLLSVALRIDKQLRQQIYPLVQSHAVWCIRTYLPHVIIYASFTPQGILLDSKLPDDMGEPDITISGSLMAIVRSVLSSDARAASKLQFRGEQETVDMSRELLQNMGLQQTITHVLGRFRQTNTNSDSTSQKKLITNYKKELEAQKEIIENLQTELEDHRKQAIIQRRQLTFAIGSSVILTLVVIGLIITNYF